MHVASFPKSRGQTDAPRVRHIHDPKIQHQVTEAGPPSKRGVLKVVATLEHNPIILKAKLICEK